MNRNWVTYQNYLAVYLLSNEENTAKGFKASVKLLKPTGKILFLRTRINPCPADPE